MVKANGLIAITCIINQPNQNEQLACCRCRYVGKESSANILYQEKLSFNSTKCEFRENMWIVSLYKTYINVIIDFDPFLIAQCITQLLR